MIKSTYSLIGHKPHIAFSTKGEAMAYATSINKEEVTRKNLLDPFFFLLDSSAVMRDWDVINYRLVNVSNYDEDWYYWNGCVVYYPQDESDFKIWKLLDDNKVKELVIGTGEFRCGHPLNRVTTPNKRISINTIKRQLRRRDNNKSNREEIEYGRS